MPTSLPKGTESTCPQKNLCVDVVEALFLIINDWKQPRHPSAGEQTNELRYIHRIESVNMFIK